MHTGTGETFPLPSDMEVNLGQIISPQMVNELLEKEQRAEEDRIRTAKLDQALRQGAPIVTVSSEVVQRLRLGDRELHRRKQRRR